MHLPMADGGLWIAVGDMRRIGLWIADGHDYAAGHPQSVRVRVYSGSQMNWPLARMC
jgi:hypothetical protein